MDIASLVISGLSALAAGIAVLFARRSALASKRSADAAADMATIDRERREEEVAEALRNRVRFKLEQVSRDSWVLTNVGTNSAYGVHVDTGDLHVDESAQYDFDEFPAGHPERYLLLRTMGTMTGHVLVTSHHQPDCSDEPPREQRLVGP